MTTPNPLDPTALDGSPAQAFASHRSRANGIAKFFAGANPLEPRVSPPNAGIGGEAGEHQANTLLAHLHAASDDPTFAVPGQKASLKLIPAALRRLKPQNDGKVGTGEDYDMAIKTFVTILYRYRHLLSADDLVFIRDKLIPTHMYGGHNPDIEICEITILLGLDTPETENHLLMIESSRYLLNQLAHDLKPDSQTDNSEQGNGLGPWLLGYMQTIAKHDFLEFNSRPYARFALHPLYNLHEFARDEPIRTAAQILLDYTMVKFALSSNRGRRVSPFRRQQPWINHQANSRNNLYHGSGDQVTEHFLAYTGYIDYIPREGQPGPFPWPLAGHGALIAGTAAYRPPPAAYFLGMGRENPPALHRFYHGTRPQLTGSPDVIDGGVEIYYSSPSFLMSAGGQFLNSGYGSDQVDVGKHAWEQTARAQATTLIPTLADAKFHDLIRFEPYPDPFVDPYADDPEDADTMKTSGTNIGVHRGLMAGGNLRPAEKKTVLEHSTSHSPALASHKGGILTAWKGSGNENLSVAKVQATTMLGIDGVEGVEDTATLSHTTELSPALASHDGRLFLAWRGSGNEHLNMAFSDDDGVTFKGLATFPESSDYSPALASHAGRLLLAWTGEGDEKLNVAKVILGTNPSGDFNIAGLESKLVLGDSSEGAPTLASHDGRLFLAWKGSGNDALNLAFSDDSAASFGGKTTFPASSSHGPSLASHAGRLFLAWKGSGNENLNVAKVALFTSFAGDLVTLEAAVVLDEKSTEPPALGSLGDLGDLLFLAWKGEGDDNLNLRVSSDGAFKAPGPWIFCDLKHLGFFVGAYRAPPTQPDALDKPLDNLGFVYAMEAGDMSFDQFKLLMEMHNQDLPATLDYGGQYEFRAPDDRTRFGIWFELEEANHRPRIVDLNDPTSGDALSTLPLVDGEYLRAPGGHDGYLEISYPGCNDRLVLDFRDATNPIRLDNALACPEPLLARVQALYEIAAPFRLRMDGDWVQEALWAMRDRVEIVDQLAHSDPQRFQLLLATVLGDVAFHNLADLDGAWMAGIRAVEIFQQLAGVPDVDDYPDLSPLVPNDRWLGLVWAFYCLGVAQRNKGRHGEALRSMRNRVRLFEQLAAQDPGKHAEGLKDARSLEAAFSV